MTHQSRQEVYKHQSPDIGLVGSGASMILRDIALMTDRIETARRGPDAYAYRDALRYTVEELAEAMISIGATASLIGYVHGGDDWRLDICAEGSTDGDMIVDALDRLRDALMINPGMTRRYVVRGQTTITARRSIAIMCLALDAVRPDDRPDFCLFAGVSRSSQDVTGDAQWIAETHDESGTLPNNY